MTYQFAQTSAVSADKFVFIVSKNSVTSSPNSKEVRTLQNSNLL